MSQTSRIRLGFIGVGSLIIVYFVFLFTTLRKGSPTTDTQNEVTTENIGTGRVPLTGENQKTGVQTTYQQQTGVLTILLPGFLNSKELQNIQKHESLSGIEVRFVEATGVDTLKTILQNKSIKADIILIPSQRWLSLEAQGLKLNLDSDLEEFLHPSVRALLNSPQATFIPYGIDPLVLFSDAKIHDFSQVRSFSDLIKQIQTQTKTKRNQMLFGRGISSDDLRLLKNNKESTQDYFLFLYEIIRQAVGGKDLKSLQILIDSLQFPNRRSAPGVIKQAKQLDDKVPYCSQFVVVCGLSNGWIAGSFGWLSDLNIWEKHFETQGQVSLKNIQIQQFPASTESVAMRARGFVIMKDSPHLTQAAKFINAYLTQASQSQKPLDEYLLSPFLQTFTLQITNKRLAPRQTSQGDFHSIIGGWELQKTFFANTPISDLLEGKYNLQQYLQDPGRKFE